MKLIHFSLDDQINEYDGDESIDDRYKKNISLKQEDVVSID